MLRRQTHFLMIALVCSLVSCKDSRRTITENPTTEAKTRAEREPTKSTPPVPKLNAEASKTKSTQDARGLQPHDQEPPFVTLSNTAVSALRAWAKRNKLASDSFYLRIVATRKRNHERAIDLEITGTVDPVNEVTGQSSGFRIAVSRTSLPYVEGGQIDFDAKSGFQFRPSNDLLAETNPSESGSLHQPAAARPARSENPVRQLTPADIDKSSWYTTEPYSNIHAQDYVGPQTCAQCHEDQHKLWQSHPHSKMNRNADSSNVVGDFSGIKVQYADGSAQFDHEGDNYLMSMFRQGELVRSYQITRTVGSRIFQMYIGVQIRGPEPPDHPIYQQERKLPFAYWIKRQEWFPETYDESACPEEYDATGQLTDFFGFYTINFRPIWQESCIWCHNTLPYEARLQRQLSGFPFRDLALTEVKNPISVGTSPTRLSLPASQLVTMGISCESCHFGGREHAVEKREIRFLPCGDNLEFAKATPQLIKNARHAPYVINGICAQCHAVGQPTFPNQASAWNSSEARDLQRGACVTAIRCTDCHNPHEAGPELAGGPDRQKFIEACLKCHEQYKEPQSAAAHTRHPSEANVSCLDCHMPRIVHGLHTLTRSHQISSPTDVRMLAKGAPNACNLCHLDRSIRWTLDELESGWGRKLTASASWQRWYGGSLDRPTGAAWLMHPAPMARQAAADAFSRSKLGSIALPQLLQLLKDPDPPTRMFGMFSVERVLGRQLHANEYRPWNSPSARERQLRTLLPARKRTSVPQRDLGAHGSGRL